MATQKICDRCKKIIEQRSNATGRKCRAKYVKVTLDLKYDLCILCEKEYRLSVDNWLTKKNEHLKGALSL